MGLGKKLKKAAKKVGRSVKKTVKNPGRIPKRVVGTVKEAVDDTIDVIDEATDDVVHIITQTGEEFETFVCSIVGKEPGVDCQISAGLNANSDGDIVLTDGSGTPSEVPENTIEALPEIDGYWTWSGEQEKDLFGESDEWVIGSPLDVMTVTSTYDELRQRNGKLVKHGALDLSAPIGTPVKSSGNGYVVFAGRAPRYEAAGIIVTVRYPQNIEMQYFHLDSVSVKVGDLVAKGATIAKTGNTGRSSGPHLHVLVKVAGKKVDPQRVFGRTMKKGTTITQQ
ncbi:M23 family metallopeptidase [Vibrio cholerae]